MEVPKMKISKKFPDENSMAEELSVPLLLMKYEYAVVNNIMVNNKLMYVKAVNPDCHTVFIHIDLDNYSVSTEDDIAMEEMNVEIVPENLIMSTMDCIGYEVCGAAFDCKDGICMAHLSDDGSVNKKTFKRKNNFGSDDVIPYPIVRLSEIKANPEKIEQYIDKTTRRIRNELVNSANKRFDQLSILIEDNTDKMTMYSDLLDVIFNKLKTEIDILERRNNNFSEITLENYKQKHSIQESLNKCNQKVLSYAMEIKKLESFISQTQSLNDQLDHSIINIKNLLQK